MGLRGALASMSEFSEPQDSAPRYSLPPSRQPISHFYVIGTYLTLHSMASGERHMGRGGGRGRGEGLKAG